MVKMKTTILLMLLVVCGNAFGQTAGAMLRGRTIEQKKRDLVAKLSEDGDAYKVFKVYVIENCVSSDFDGFINLNILYFNSGEQLSRFIRRDSLYSYIVRAKKGIENTVKGSYVSREDHVFDLCGKVSGAESDSVMMPLYKKMTCDTNCYGFGSLASMDYIDCYLALNEIEMQLMVDLSVPNDPNDYIDFFFRLRDKLLSDNEAMRSFLNYAYNGKKTEYISNGILIKLLKHSAIDIFADSCLFRRENNECDSECLYRKMISDHRNYNYLSYPNVDVQKDAVKYLESIY